MVNNTGVVRLGHPSRISSTDISAVNNIRVLWFRMFSHSVTLFFGTQRYRPEVTLDY